MPKIIAEQSNMLESLILESHLDDFSFRILNPLEVENLTDDALEHLLNLRQSSSISEECFEEVLIDVSSIFGILDLECLKDLLNYRGVNSKKIIN